MTLLLIILGIVLIGTGLAVTLIFPDLPGGKFRIPWTSVEAGSAGTLVFLVGAGFVGYGASSSGSAVRGSGSGTVALSTPQLRGSYAVFDAGVTTRGLKGRRATIRWTLYDANAQRPVGDAHFVEQVADRFVPKSQDEQRATSIRVPAPSTQTDLVFLRVELFNDEGERLAFDDSGHLRLTGQP